MKIKQTHVKDFTCKANSFLSYIYSILEFINSMVIYEFSFLWVIHYEEIHRLCIKLEPKALIFGHCRLALVDCV